MKKIILLGTLGWTLLALAGCDDAKYSCEYNRQLYDFGAAVESNDCNSCFCDIGGNISCTDMACTPEGCQYGGMFYQVGDSFAAHDGCNTCYCEIGGGVSCTEMACPTPYNGFEAELTSQAGCADMWAYANNPEDTTAIVLILTDVVANAFAQQADTTYEYTLPTPGVDLSVLVGRDLTCNYCNDVPMGEPDITQTLVPISGDLTVTITRTGPEQAWETPAHADVLLENVVFEDETSGHTVTVERFEMIDVYVGWYPG